MNGQSETSRGEAARWSERGLGFALGAAVVVGIIVAMAVAWRVVVVVFLSILLASAIEPVISRGRDRLPVARGIALLGIYAGLALALVALLVLLLPGAITDAAGIVVGLPAALARLDTWAAELKPDVLASAVGSLADAARAALSPAGPPRADEVVGVGLTVAEIVGATVTVLALVYFWITERARLQRYATAFLPLDRRAGAREAWNDIEMRLGGWVGGQLVLMGSVALAAGTAYWLLGLPSALVLGLIAGLAELIPLVGPILGAIPALLVAAATRPDLVLPVLIVYVAIQLVESNWLMPIVMRGTVGIPPFVVVVSLLVGGAIAGLVGALMAIPLAAVAVVLLERMQAREVPVVLDPAAAGSTVDAQHVHEELRASTEAPADATGR